MPRESKTPTCKLHRRPASLSTLEPYAPSAALLHASFENDWEKERKASISQAHMSLALQLPFNRSASTECSPEVSWAVWASNCLCRWFVSEYPAHEVDAELLTSLAVRNNNSATCIGHPTRPSTATRCGVQGLQKQRVADSNRVAAQLLRDDTQ